MNPFKKLASDTAIYGMSSIIGRFLNWWLVPYYVFLFEAETYGIITNLYSYAAVLMILLTYGMETGYFRFASKSEHPEKVYSTSVISILFTSALFLVLVVPLKNTIASWLNYKEHAEYVLWIAIIVSIDALTAIPFAKLRLKNRPIKFVAIKLINIGFAIGLNIFFLSICPSYIKNHPDSWLRFVYSENIGVGYVFISNLLASILTFVLLLPEFFKLKIQFDPSLLSKILNYSFPILIVGMAGILSQHIDKILIPFLIPENENPMQQLGIYGASFKMAVLMNMFIQAFRYAFEPFFFARKNSSNDKAIYALVMKYFIIFGLFIFLGMMFYIDLVSFIFDEQYMEGIKVLPIILMGNLFFGIYFTLSLWYKLTDKTKYGAYMALTGSFITIVLNFILIPILGYMGSAVTFFTSMLVITLISYFLGKKHYPIPYDLKSIALYFMSASFIYILSFITKNGAPLFKYTINTFLLIVFAGVIFFLERKNLGKLIIKQKK